MMVAVYYAVLVLQFGIIGYLLIFNLLSLFLFFVATWKIKRYLDLGKMTNLRLLYHHPGMPGVTFLMPAYNEENNIVESLTSLMNLYFPRIEIIMVNDGSTDGTFQRVKEHFGFQKKLDAPAGKLGTAHVIDVYEIPKEKLKEKSHIRRILLVNKENGGKADALNVGINFASEDYVCSMDADSLMDKYALLTSMRPFLEDPDKIVGIGGQVGIVNGAKVEKGKVTSVGLPKKGVERFQVIEYARSFNVGRTGLATLSSLVVLSGVFSIFRRDLVLKIGGYLTRFCGGKETVCEDMEIVVRLYRYLQENNIKGKVEYLPFPISWTEVPSSYKDLANQRNRWFRGLAESLWFHKRMLFNPFYRQTGLFAVPYQVIFELVGPLFELFGYLSLPVFYFLGYLNMTYLILFFLLAIVFGMFLSIMTLFLGVWVGSRYQSEYSNYNIFYSRGFSDIFLLIIYALFSNIGYRQFLLVAQAKGLWDLCRGKKSWEKFTHKGFAG